MKRVSLLVLAFVACAVTASAQIKFGGKAGINLAQIAGKSEGDSEKSDSKIGLHVGALVEIPVSENLSIMPELNFDQWGGKEEDAGEDFKYKFNYINVPILVKANFSNFGVYVGPQVGFLASAKVGNEDLDVDFKDELKAIDFGAVAGVEYNLPMGLFVTARYNLGLAQINEDGDDDNYLKNRAFTVGVGIKLGGSGNAKRK